MFYPACWLCFAPPQAILSWAAFKHRHTIPARDLGAHVATLALSMLGMLWLRLDVARCVCVCVVVGAFWREGALRSPDLRGLPRGGVEQQKP